MNFITLQKTFCFILLGALVLGCRNPTSETFQRNSPFDPGSQNFDPSLQLSSDLNIQLLELNTFRISWPQIVGVEKYQILRNEYDSEHFELLLETNTYTDTTYIDILPESGNYSYSINYISPDNDTLSLQSDHLLSYWFEGPQLSFDMENFRIDGSPSFAMKTGTNSALIHYLEAFNETPIITKLNLENSQWSVLNFQELTANEDWLRSGDFYRVDSNRFIVIKKFFRREIQNHLGYLCTISTESCIKIGDYSFDEDSEPRFITYTTLLDGKIMFTFFEGDWPFQEIPAFIFNPTNSSVTKISSPINNMHPSTLTSFNNDKVIACQSSPGVGDPSLCQIYSLSNNQWSRINPIPEPLYNMNSALLNSDKIFFKGKDLDSDQKSNTWLYDPELDSWKSMQASRNTNHLIFNPNNFVNNLYQSLNGNIITITHSISPENRFLIENFIIEVFDPQNETWIKAFRLPDYVENIFNFIQLDENKFLVTYGDGNFPVIPQSAIIYIE